MVKMTPNAPTLDHAKSDSSRGLVLKALKKAKTIFFSPFVPFLALS